MTKVETIRTAGTVEEIKAVLLGSARVTDMAEAYQAVTGYSYGGRLRGISREEIASKMASEMMTMRENGRFKSLSAEEKYAELKTLKELPKKLSLCTIEELEAVAGMLEIDEAEYANKSGYDKKRELESQITVKLEVKKLEELKTAGSHEEMREMLKMCDTSRLAEIAKMVRERLLGKDSGSQRGTQRSGFNRLGDRMDTRKIRSRSGNCPDRRRRRRDRNGDSKRSGNPCGD